MTDEKTEIITPIITTPVRAQKPEEYTAEVVIPNRTPAAMMQIALEHNADPAVLQKLLDIQEQWEATQARKAYVDAMTKFKSECPAVLGKDATVDFPTSKGRTRYTHATLGGIVSTITPMLSQNGLSISWETTQGNNMVSVTCHITHCLGHRESTTLVGPRDESGNKNMIQAVGSAVTYLQRYTLLSALGLATADQDNDGGAGERKPVAMPKETTKKPTTHDGATISDKQAKRLFAIATNANVEQDALKQHLVDEYGISHTRDITRDTYEEICAWAEAGGQVVE